jgi:hypothetical protein
MSAECPRLRKKKHENISLNLSIYEKGIYKNQAGRRTIGRDGGVFWLLAISKGQDF